MYPVRETWTSTPAISARRWPKYRRSAQSGARRTLEDVAGAWPLQGDGRHLFGDVVDPHVEPGRVHREPPEAGVGRGPEELLVAPARDGPVVDDLAVLVAPRGVDHAIDGELRGVARHDPVDEPRGVGPGDLVLVERGHVDQRGLLADRVVLDVVEVGVHRGREVARPLAPGHRGVQRRGARVERRADAQRSLLEGSMPARSLAAPLGRALTISQGAVGPPRTPPLRWRPWRTGTTRSSSGAGTTA